MPDTRRDKQIVAQLPSGGVLADCIRNDFHDESASEVFDGEKQIFSGGATPRFAKRAGGLMRRAREAHPLGR